MSSYSEAPRDPFRRGFGGSGRSRAIVPTIVILVALGVLVAVFTNFWTDRLWYDAIEFGSVFTTTLLTKIGLFVVFGLVFGAIVFVNLAIAYRLRPRYRAMSGEQQTLDRYRDVVDPHKTLIGLVVAGLLGLIAGSSAASRWNTYLGWINATPFGQQDKQFGIDVSFYVFGYPWYRFLLGFGFAVVVLSLIAAAAAHYLYGGVRLQTQGQRASAAAQAHVSVLVGLFVLLKATAYWFDRYGLMLGAHRMSRQEFTGITYADAHALLPAKTILTFIALICAVLFFANVVRRTWLLPGLGLGLLVLSAVLLGWLWPTIIQQVHVSPSEPDLERPFIERNIEATREAYGVADAKVEPYTAKTSVTRGQLSEDQDTIPGIRLVDPTVVPSTFEQLQQVRGFYTFSNPLDVDRYNIDGETQDAVVAVREIDLNGVPADQRNWANDHTVFTHGFGFVSAYGNRKNDEGGPVWMEGGIPPEGELGKFQPRIYYGESSPPYSFVGAPEGTPPVEMDIPGGSNSEDSTYTYEGKGGVSVGSLLNQLLYASKFQDANILLSGRVNSESKIMYDRAPRERVQKVAPWLTIESDSYPAVVDGRIKWIVDGYTMSDKYPQSRRLDVEDATSDSLTEEPAITGQPSAQVNYIRNSVKAVVDAYDGTVTLYAWNPKDPMLRTWMKAFPGTVQPKSEMPKELLAHLRYPTDLMKIQREVLAQYHVTDPMTFYDGSERWRVPSDPSQEQGRQKQPAYYLSVKMPGQDKPTFSLTSTYIYFNRQNLAAFVAVNADARSKDYGTMHVLEVVGTDDGKPGGPDESGQEQVDGPRQIANKLEGDQQVAQALLRYKRPGGGNEVIHGNLLTLPVGGGLLYVQPVYVERTGEGAYPLLRLVQASFGGQVGIAPTLEGALDMVFAGESGADTGEQDTGEQDTSEGDTGDGEDRTRPDEGGPANAEVAAALAEAADAFEKADAALKEGNLADYERYVKAAQESVQRAMELQDEAQSAGEGGSNETPEPTPESTPPSPSPTPNRR